MYVVVNNPITQTVKGMESVMDKELILIEWAFKLQEQGFNLDYIKQKYLDMYWEGTTLRECI